MSVAVASTQAEAEIQIMIALLSQIANPKAMMMPLSHRHQVRVVSRAFQGCDRG
jgi:hypothetical protein